MIKEDTIKGSYPEKKKMLLKGGRKHKSQKTQRARDSNVLNGCSESFMQIPINWEEEKSKIKYVAYGNL